MVNLASPGLRRSTRQGFLVDWASRGVTRGQVNKSRVNKAVCKKSAALTNSRGPFGAITANYVPSRPRLSF